MKTINTFRGNYQFLSNFYSANVTYNGITYSNNEAAFQAQKVLTDAERMPFVGMKPGEAKSYGRKVKLRSDWENVKLNVMYDIVLAKFVQNSDLKEALLATGDAELVEGNTWNDRYWGVCNGSGSNHLGQILMTVRKTLKEENIMNNNTNVAANNNTNTMSKEDKTMKNQNNATNNNIILAMKKEEIAMKTKDELRIALELVGVTMSNKEFKKTKKAALVEQLEKYLDPTKVVEYEVPTTESEAVVAEEPVVEAQKEVSMGTYEKLLKAVAKEIINQTLVMKNGKLVTRDYALFYKATKTESQNYLIVGKRLWGVVSKVITDLYGEKFKTKENIQKTLDKMVEFNLITLVENERNFVLLTPSDLSQDEKDQLNDAWRKKLVTTEKGKDERVKVSAANEAGKTFLNQLYPCWTYQATAAQMNYMFKISR